MRTHSFRTHRFDSGARLLSITFDDGLSHGAKVAADILARYSQCATFYVVTGWVEPIRAPVREVFNKGRQHGDWSFWRDMAAHGHEIGSHTFSHLNAAGRTARFLPWIVPRELRRSLDDLAREVPQTAYTISMPWNAATPRSEGLVKGLYAACRLGAGNVAFGALDALEPYKLASWAPTSDIAPAEYARVIRSIPPGGWLILQFHSFDNEGYQPLRRETFDALCRIAAEEPGLKVATVADVIGRMTA